MGGFREFAHFFDGGGHVPLAEQSRAANKGIGAGPGAIDDGLEIHTPIHPDIKMQVLFTTPGVSLLNLRERFVNERLSTKPWVHRHDE